MTLVDSLLRNEDLFAAAGRYGYLHPGYAEAFVEAGEVRHLRRSGSFLLARTGRGLRRLDLGTVDADPASWTAGPRMSGPRIAAAA